MLTRANRFLRRSAAIAVLGVGGLTVAAPAAAQGSYEIQVYPSALAPPRSTMFELHSNVTPSGITTTSDGTQPNDDAVHETLEITHGFNEWFETGFYVFTSARAGDGWQYVGSHIRPRFSIPERFKWPVGLSLSQEIGYQRSMFSADTWTWEIRPIIDQQLGPVNWSVNVAFEKTLQGEHVNDGWGIAPAAKLAVDVTPKVALGLEYYGDIGSTKNIAPWRSCSHQLFGVMDLNLAPEWEFNAGLGFGLTPASDSFVIKVIVGYRIGK